MNVTIDFGRRIKKIRKLMKQFDIDVLIGTRMASVTFVSGHLFPGGQLFLSLGMVVWN